MYVEKILVLAEGKEAYTLRIHSSFYFIRCILSTVLVILQNNQIVK